MTRKPLILFAGLLVLPLLACGGELPSMRLPAVVAASEPQPDPEPLPAPKPEPEACLAAEEDPVFDDSPICDALSPLRAVFLGAQPILVEAGTSVDLLIALQETSGRGMYRYPGVATSSEHPAVTIEGALLLYGIAGCQTVETPFELTVPASVPSGVEFDVDAEVMSLEGTCERAHRVQVRVRVL